MNGEYVFYPPRRNGLIFHLVAITLLTLGGGWALWQAVNSSVGPTFIFYLLPFLIALPIVPFLIYRLNNLDNASYALERDSLSLRWGLRLEVIPMMDVQWIRPAGDLQESLRLPPIRWPGAVLGTRRLSGGRITIEFLAAHSRDLLVIATSKQFYAISPANPSEFLLAYQHFTELGSLLPPAPRSVYPTILISRAWRDRLSRTLIFLGFLLGLGVLIWVSLVIPNMDQVSLGFLPDGTPKVPIPSIRLMLLPILNGFIFLVNFFIGLAFFRREATKPLAYLLWGASVVVSILFLVALYFIL